MTPKEKELLHMLLDDIPEEKTLLFFGVELTRVNDPDFLRRMVVTMARMYRESVYRPDQIGRKTP